MYDTIIIGLGCAGYTAAIYCARYKLSVFLVGEEEGGMGNGAAEVGNWPGDIEVKGPQLMERFKNHAVSFDTVDMKIARVKSVKKITTGFEIETEGKKIQGKTIIFATGSSKRKLGLPGEKELAGRGVTYCATCDAFFYRGKEVAVIGGGDSAVEGAAILAQVASKVYLIHRRDQFRAEPFWVDKVKEKENIHFILKNQVTEIIGDEVVNSVKLSDSFEGSDILNVQGVFIEVGTIPSSNLAKDLGCSITDRGFIRVDAAMKTSVPGAFAAGDVTDASNHFEQFTTAAGEAAVAGNSVFNYLSSGTFVL